MHRLTQRPLSKAYVCHGNVPLFGLFMNNKLQMYEVNEAFQLHDLHTSDGEVQSTEPVAILLLRL